MGEEEIEATIKACYSTWSTTYYDDYYGEKATYTPVHREILKGLLREKRVRTLLDAGCGPASFLREIAGEGIDLYGFDLTPEMIAEARSVMQKLGHPPDHFWEGSVLIPDSYQIPDRSHSGRSHSGGSERPELERPEWDAVLCIGVLPHVPADADMIVIENLHRAVREDGLVVLEARNQLFSLFTHNRYSYQFMMEELIRAEDLKTRAGEHAQELASRLEELKNCFRTDLPPIRTGKQDEPGYDEVLSRTHNPLVLRQQFGEAGFRDVRILFYHFHCLPPMLEASLPDLFVRESLAMENPEDWRGYFMASAFLLAGRRG